MKTNERKTGKTAKLKDLPAKRLTREEQDKVKGGTVPPIAGNRLPKPAGPING